jgi:hypothetical protein
MGNLGIYQPKDMPEIEISYVIFPGSPAFDDEIETQQMQINGEDVSLKLESHLMEYFEFEDEILKGLKSRGIV